MGVRLRYKECAARRNSWPARFFTLCTPFQSTRPPLMSLSAHSASQEAKCADVEPPRKNAADLAKQRQGDSLHAGHLSHVHP